MWLYPGRSINLSPASNYALALSILSHRTTLSLHHIRPNASTEAYQLALRCSTSILRQPRRLVGRPEPRPFVTIPDLYFTTENNFKCSKFKVSEAQRGVPPHPSRVADPCTRNVTDEFCDRVHRRSHPRNPTVRYVI